ncbi:MAG: hypothetical protein ABIK28_24225, partial [Planctomycetota bacterium]
IKTSKKEKDGEVTIKITCEKAKDAPEFEPINVLLKEVNLGPEDSSCIVVKGEIRVREEEDSPRTIETTKIVDALRNSPHTSGTSTTELQALSGLKRTTFYKTRNYLIINGIIKNIGTDSRPKWTLKENEMSEVSAGSAIVREVSANTRQSGENEGSAVSPCPLGQGTANSSEPLSTCTEST